VGQGGAHLSKAQKLKCCDWGPWPCNTVQTPEGYDGHKTDKLSAHLVRSEQKTSTVYKAT